MVVSDLNRFLDAQNEPDSGFACALEEIRAGGKQGHWIWYIFPQVAGLGYSALSRRYAISDLHEARAYLQNPELRKRLLAITAAVAELSRAGHPLTRVMGSSIDAAKLVSSLTLFAHVGRALHVDEELDAYQALAALAEEILATAARQGYPRCRFTLDRIRDWEGSR